MVDSFCTLSSELRIGEGCAIHMGLRHWCPSYGFAHINGAHAPQPLFETILYVCFQLLGKKNPMDISWFLLFLCFFLFLYCHVYICCEG